MKMFSVQVLGVRCIWSRPCVALEAPPLFLMFSCSGRGRWYTPYLISIYPSSLEADCLNYDSGKREETSLRSGEGSDLLRVFSAMCLGGHLSELNEFHYCKEQGAGGNSEDRSSRIVFLPWSPAPPSSLSVNVGLSFGPPHPHRNSLPKILFFQLVTFKEHELGLSWQHRDFQAWCHLPLGEVMKSDPGLKSVISPGSQEF